MARMDRSPLKRDRDLTLARIRKAGHWPNRWSRLATMSQEYADLRVLEEEGQVYRDGMAGDVPRFRPVSPARDEMFTPEEIMRRADR